MSSLAIPNVNPLDNGTPPNPAAPAAAPLAASGFSSAISNCFSNLAQSIQNSCIGRFYQRCVSYSPLVSDLTGVIVNIANAKTFSYMLNFVFDTTAASSSQWKGQEWALKAIRDAKLLAAVTIPVALYSVIRDGYEVALGTEKIDASLRVAENLSWLGDSTATVISGLEVTGAIPEGAVAATFFPISIASGCLATATIALNARRLYQNQQLLKEMNAQGSDDQVLTLLTSKDEYFLNKNFNVEGGKLKTTLQEIQTLAQNKLSGGDAHASQGVLQQTVRSLKERISTKNWSHALSILSSTVTLIGMSILLFTPLSPVAYSLMAAAALVSVIKFLYERRALKHFATTLERIKNL